MLLDGCFTAQIKQMFSSQPSLFLFQRSDVFNECYGRDLPKVWGTGQEPGYAELNLVKLSLAWKVFI